MTKHSINIIGDIEDPQLMSGISLLIEMGYPVTIKKLAQPLRQPLTIDRTAKTVSETVERQSNTQAPMAAEVHVKKIPMGVGADKIMRFRHPSGKTAVDVLMSYVHQRTRNGHKTRMEDVVKFMRGEGFAKTTAYTALSSATSADKVVHEGGYIWWKEGAP